MRLLGKSITDTSTCGYAGQAYHEPAARLVSKGRTPLTCVKGLPALLYLSARLSTYLRRTRRVACALLSACWVPY
jgi:hypothetical protein